MKRMAACAGHGHPQPEASGGICKLLAACGPSTAAARHPIPVPGRRWQNPPAPLQPVLILALKCSPKATQVLASHSSLITGIGKPRHPDTPAWRGFWETVSKSCCSRAVQCSISTVLSSTPEGW